MKKVIVLACLAGACATTHAASNGYLQYGGANVGSFATRSVGLGALTGNPASGTFLMRKDQTFRSGILGLPHVGYEVGDVDNFTDDIERLEDELDRTDLTASDAAALEAEFDALLKKIGKDGYINLDVEQQVPAMPMAFRAFNGVMTLDLALEGRAGIRILDDPAGVEVVDPETDGTFELESDSAAYIRTGRFIRASLGYSRALPPIAALPLAEGQSLTGGVRLNIIKGALGKAVAALDSDSEEEDAFDRVEENYEDNEKEATALGLDVGAIYSRGNLTFGTTIYNLIAPKFDFGKLDAVCAGVTDPGQLEDCATVAAFAGEVNVSESFKEKTRLNGEVGYKVLGSNWVVGGALDFNKVPSLAGGDFQWASLSAGYESPNWWLPGFAIGYKQNLAGSKLSYATLGFSLLSALSLNMSYGLESTEIDGSSGPRSAAVALAFEVPL